MSKLFTIPASRLICFGSARGHTNGPNDGDVLEANLIDTFKP